ncbi:CYFA0S01e04984g1_1 [Cyberlindnera fabianii]|uniref:CYFA0S01e04984g1_1 n=1 Tax=Cyberlindnera fabianii TaxID=36022 RepID=A0A061AQ50_CYBFA|nr:CYFA0S01e04984g1_1 [Cyberlindnera fabianii]
MATTTSSIINLTKTIVGAGLLAIPFAFKANGILFGILLILLGGIAAWYGLYIVARVSDHIEGETSFFALCAITYPKLTLLFDFSIAIQCFGVALSYLVLFGDLVPSLIGEYLTRNQVIVMSLVFIVPLISFRRLDSLKFGSLVGLIAIAYLTLLVLGHALIDDLSLTRGELRVIRPGPLSEVLSAFSIVVFAFTAAQNICTIINEIDDKRKVNWVIIASCLGAGILFTVVGLAGYLQFGSNITGNVILNYDPTLITSRIGKSALTLMVGLSFPLMFHPCRISINNMIHWIETELNKEKQGETRPLLSSDNNNNNDDVERSHVEVPFSTNRFIAVTVILCTVIYLLALSVTSFELVLALVGATGSTLICFILPGLFGYKLLETPRERYMSLALTIWGTAVMIAAVFATLRY